MAVARGARRLGLFGGAFDPPHVAHRAIAMAALQQLGLERLYVVPTGRAWHRCSPALTDGAHRLAMVRLAFAGLMRVTVDDCELQREGPSYTIDTLTALQQANPGSDWTLVIGGDQARAFGRWHRWQELAGMVTVAVALRPDLGADTQAAQDLREQGVRVVALRVAPMAVSASAVRQAVAAGQDVAPLVGCDVARYIEQHQLYRNPDDR